MEGDLQHIPGINGSVLLYSLWSGYREKNTTKKFLDTVKSLGVTERPLHTGGHASISALRGLVDVLQPRKLFPIHTFHPEEYATFGCDIQLLQDGEEYLL
jgi:ribonuclease J